MRGGGFGGVVVIGNFSRKLNIWFSYSVGVGCYGYRQRRWVQCVFWIALVFVVLCGGNGILVGNGLNMHPDWRYLGWNASAKNVGG